MRSMFNRGAFLSIRKKNHLSQAQVAELADTSIRYVGALERGEKSKPSADLVSRFSIILEVPVAWRKKPPWIHVPPPAG